METRLFALKRQSIGWLLRIMIMAMAALTTAWSQGQTFGWAFEWARAGGGSGWKHGNAITADAAGNSFIVGEFSGAGGDPAITFTDPANNTHDLSTTAGTEGFIVMYDEHGTVQWVEHPRLVGRSGSVTARAVAVGKDINNVKALYVAGSIDGTVDFSALNPGLVVRTALPGSTYIAKYALPASGGPVVQWAAIIGPQSQSESTPSNSAAIRGITTGAAGTVYLCGTYTDTTYFESTRYIAAPSQTWAFVARYDDNGGSYAKTWVSTTQGGNIIPTGIAANSSDVAFITGHFRGSVLFSTTVPLSGAAANDNLFVAACGAQLNGQRDFLWAVGVPGGASSWVTGAGIAVDGSNARIVGTFKSSALFTSTSLTAPAGGTDYFVATLDMSPAQPIWTWAKQGHGNQAGEAIGNGIALGSGRIYITGTFSGTMNPSAPSSAVTLGSIGNHDIFVAEYDLAGQAGWGARAGNSPDNAVHNHYDQGIGITTSNGFTGAGIFIVGEFGGTGEPHDARFPGTDGLTADHFRNVFAAKLTARGIMTISGTVMAHTPTSIPAAHQLITISDPNGYALDYVLTGPDGGYTAQVPAGSTVSVGLISNGAIWNRSPATPYSISTPSSNVNFELLPKPPGPVPDIHITMEVISTENAVPGKEVRYLITYSNLGSAPTPACYVYLAPDPILTPNGNYPGPGATFINGIPMKWSLGTLAPMQSGTIVASFLVPSTASTGGHVISTVDMFDAALAHASDGTDQELVSPSDPNGKHVNPNGNLSVVRVREGRSLLYSVEYYNVGTGPVQTVNLYDTLDHAIDLVGAAPLPMKNWGPVATSATIPSSGNVPQSRIFPFVDANLMPIQIDPANIGYATFSATLDKYLPVGTRVRNQAVVEFVDVNTKMPTNVVENCIAADFGVVNTCLGSPTQFTLATQTGSYLPPWVNLSSIRWDFGDDSTSTDPSPSHLYPGPGTYHVTLTFSDSLNRRRWLCDQFDTIFRVTKLVTITSSPTPTITPSSGDSLVASAGAGYEWFFNNSLVGTRQRIHAHTPGIYTLCVTYKGGCRLCRTYEVTTGAVPPEPGGDLAVTIRPNPGSGPFTLELGGPAMRGGSFSVIGMRGETVRHGRIDRGERSMMIDLAGEPSGGYVVRIEVDGRSGTRSLILRR